MRNRGTIFPFLRDRWETDDRFLPTGRLLPLNELEQGIVRGAGPRGVRVSGFYRSAGPLAGVGPFGYRVSASFTDWVLFARPGEDWISIEPQSGPVDGFNRPDVCTLASGASVCFAQAIGLYAALQAP